MIKVIFPGELLSSLLRQFSEQSHESFALILARPVKIEGRSWRLLVQAVHIPSDAEYDLRTATAVRASAAFRLPYEKHARLHGLSLIYCHSHPHETGVPNFSDMDDATERLLAVYCQERVPKVPHIALLLGQQAVRARELGCGGAAEVIEVGRRVVRWFPGLEGPVAPKHDRQVRAFGEDGQRAIQALRVALVGLGGIGSVVAQQLSHLGVSRYLLIDPECLEDTNLNRVVGTVGSDVGRSKVSLARRMIRRIVTGAHVETVQGNILDIGVGERLRDVDFIFCCTDSHGSRFFLNQLAYQYFVPCIDMGVVIQVHEGTVTHYGGRAQLLAPSLSCLACIDGILDPREVRWDLSNEAQRQQDPYFLGHAGVKQPAVVSLNSTVASLGVSMFLMVAAGVPGQARSQLYRGIRGDVRVLDDKPRPECINCSTTAYYGKGAQFKLPSRAS